MMTSRQNTAERLWLELMFEDRQPLTAKPSDARPRLAPHEVKANETTRVARALTDAVAELRQANTARLRQARLGQEAEDAARAALTPPKKARRKAR